MDNITFRPATADDAETLYHVKIAAFADEFELFKYAEADGVFKKIVDDSKSGNPKEAMFSMDWHRSMCSFGDYTLVIEDGAKMYTTWGLYIGQGQYDYATAVGLSNSVTVTGTNSYVYIHTQSPHVYVGGRNATGNVLRVTDGARLDTTSTGQVYLESVGGAVIVENGAAWTNGLHLQMRYGEGSTFQVRGTHSIASVGGQLNIGGTGEGGASGDAVSNGVWVTEGALLVVGGHASLGGGSAAMHNHILVDGAGSCFSNRLYDIHIGNNGNSNRVVVSNGGMLFVDRSILVGKPLTTRTDVDEETGDETVTVTGGAGVGNLLRIENGTVDITKGGNSGSVTVHSGGRIEIAGTNSILHTKAGLQMNGTATLSYTIGKEGYAEDYAPIRTGVGGTSGFFSNPNGTACLEIDAKEYAMNGGGRIVLMKLYNGSQSALDDLVLPGNVTWVGGIAGSVEVEDLARQLVAYIPNLAATMILLR